MTNRTAYSNPPAPKGATAIDALFAVAAAIDSLATAVTRISHGDANGPTGLEIVSMAMIGDGLPGHDSVASAIRDGFGDIAEAIEATR